MKWAISAVIAVCVLVGCGAAASSSQPPSTSAPPSANHTATVTATAEVIAHRMGLTSAGGYVAYIATTDPNHLLGRQNGYTSKVNWGDHNEVALWGSIEVFPDNAEATTRDQEVSSLVPPLGDGYDTVAGDALLRLGTVYTPAQAAQLKAAFLKAAG